MSCLEQYSTASDYILFWCVEDTSCSEDEAIVKRFLRRAAGTINMARQAQGACDCTLSATSLAYLRDLSIVLAVVYHSCPCAHPNLTVEEKQMYLNQATTELTMIRKGEIELCEGATGADFPSIGWAEQSLTIFNTAEIIYNETLRSG